MASSDSNSKIYKELKPIVKSLKKPIQIARNTAWRVKVKGVDVTDTIRQNMISLDITDNEEAESDDLQIKIADRDAVWLQKWLNDTIQAGSKTKGLKFCVWIGTVNDKGKILQQKCGTFQLDSVKHSGPPCVTVIKCLSMVFGGGIQTEKRSKAWENYTMAGIAGEIAGKAGLSLVYDSSKNPTYARKQQDDETDLDFLIRLCKDLALSLKFTDTKMVIFDKHSYEAKGSVKTIKFGDGSYMKWDLGTTTGDIAYDSCTVKYTDPKTGVCVSGTYKSPEYDTNKADQHQELVITDEKVKTSGEAMAIAEMRLKMQNLFQTTVSFTLQGNPGVMAGQTITLKKWGYWDGKYMVAKATHSLSRSGYTTKITLRKI
jgi:phage protein D